MAVSAPIVFENVLMRIPMSTNPAHHIDVIKQYIDRAFYFWKLINANVKDRNPAWNSSWWIKLRLAVWVQINSTEVKTR